MRRKGRVSIQLGHTLLGSWCMSRRITVIAEVHSKSKGECFPCWAPQFRCYVPGRRVFRAFVFESQ